MRRIILLLSLLHIFVGTGQSQVPTTKLTANDLVAECTIAVEGTSKIATLPRAVEAGHCYGYIDAFVEVNSMLGNNLFCERRGVTADQRIEIFLKYMNDRPEDLRRGGWEMLAFAMQAAFPCPDRK
jgi:hypothetical protein